MTTDAVVKLHSPPGPGHSQARDCWQGISVQATVPSVPQEPDQASAAPASLADLLQELQAIRRQLTRPGVEPELLRAPDAATLCGVSTASWARLASASKTPRAVRLGGCVGWRRSELLAWIAADCPDENAWSAIKQKNLSE